jgi:hypothetical protein
LQTVENEFIHQINAPHFANQALLTGKSEKPTRIRFSFWKSQHLTGKRKNFQEKPERYKKKQNLTGMASSLQETGKV